VVLLVSVRTGSYTDAGVLAAVVVLAGAVGGPPLARLIDLFGQTVVIPVAGALSAVGFGLLIVAVEAGWPAEVSWLAGRSVACAFLRTGRRCGPAGRTR